MRVLSLLVKLLLFVVLLAFAAGNTELVAVHYFVGREWHAPLTVVVFAFFAVGTLLGVLAVLPRFLRMRRRLAHLEKQPASAAARPAPLDDVALSTPGIGVELPDSRR